MLVLMALAGRASGLDAVGLVILATSTGYLVAAVADFGLSTQTARWFARMTDASRAQLRGPLLVRTLGAIPIALAIAWLLFTSSFPDLSDPGWIVSTALLAGAYCASLITTQAAYGSGRFRRTATLNGGIRLLSVGLLLLASFAGAAVWSLVLVVAVAEYAIAVLQYQSLSPVGAASTEDLTPRRTWPFAVGPIANNLMNRSDTVVVAAVATAVVVSSYALASQIENALTTIALVPAGAATVYAARRSGGAMARQLGVVSTVVGGIYVVLAIPVAIAPSVFTNVLFGVVPPSEMPIRICLLAGIFSCLAGVAIMLLNGAGDGRGTAAIWTSAAVASVVFLMGGAWLFGADGAAYGALIRDVLLFGLAWTRLRIVMRRSSEH